VFLSGNSRYDPSKTAEAISRIKVGTQMSDVEIYALRGTSGPRNVHRSGLVNTLGSNPVELSLNSYRTMVPLLPSTTE